MMMNKTIKFYLRVSGVGFMLIYFGINYFNLDFAITPIAFLYASVFCFLTLIVVEIAIFIVKNYFKRP